MTKGFQNRCVLLCTVLVLGLSGLSWRVIQIQMVDRARLAKISLNTYHRTETLSAMRGMIVDRNLTTIAKSIPVSDLLVDKNHLFDPVLAVDGLAYQEACCQPGWAAMSEKKRRKTLSNLRKEIYANQPAEIIRSKYLAYAVATLAHPLGMRRDELRDLLEKPKLYKGKEITSFVIAKELPADEADKLRSIIDEYHLKGFLWENSIKRFYPMPQTATHLTGFTIKQDAKDRNGRVVTRLKGEFGLESAMEKYLAGRDGWREHKRDGRGRVVTADESSIMPPRAGLNVKLCLDLGIQRIAEEELDAGLAEYVSKQGCIVIMDPADGAVLAMASRPHFDLNKLEKIDTNSFNYALQGIYEPGSVFKIVSTSGAMNERLATRFTNVFCHHGKFVEGSLTVPDHHGYGNLSLENVLAKSSNIGAYKFARQLGMKRFYGYVDRYGFGKKTGIRLSGESEGIIRNTGNPTDFSRAAYGYALSVTPLQIACAYSAIAGDGNLLKPRIVDSLIANDGTVVEEFPREVVNQAIRPEVARQMRLALQKVTEKGGTATQAAVPGYHVAGKTGTAKLLRPNRRGYMDNRYTSSFAGFMPVEKPEFVAVVVIVDPLTNKVSRMAGTVAAPIFSKLATRVAQQMNLKPTEPIPTTLAIAAP